MTPFELSLGHDLEVERQRFGSAWLFKWYGMTYEGGKTDVEDFRGGKITYAGNRFEGQPQTIYWQAVGRYLNGKVHSTFQKWDQETRSYPAALRSSSLEGTERLLLGFVAKVARHATETDQALRGHGHPKTDVPREGSAAHTHANVEIYRLTTAHKALMPTEPKTEMVSSVQGRFADALNLKPGLFGVSIDLKKLFSGWRK